MIHHKRNYSYKTGCVLLLILTALLFIGCSSALRYRLVLEDRSFRDFDHQKEFILAQYLIEEGGIHRTIKVDTLTGTGRLVLGPLSPDTTYRFIFTRRMFGEGDEPAISCAMTESLIYYSDLKKWTTNIDGPVIMNEYDCLSMPADSFQIDMNVKDTSLWRDEGQPAF